MPLSYKKLIGLFLATFFSCFFLFMPASLVLSMAEVDKTLQYQKVDGNLWHMRVKGAAIQGFYLGDIEYKPSPKVVFGGLTGDIIYRGAGRSASFQFALEDNQRLYLSGASFAVPITVQNTVLPIEGVLSAQAETFVYDIVDGCIGGELFIRSDMLAPVFANTPWSAPILEGTTICDAGVLKVLLAGENDVINVEADVFWRGSTNIQALLKVIPKAGIGAEQQVIAMMQMAGFVQQNNAWQKQLVMRF